MKITVYGSGTGGGQAYKVELLRVGITNRIDNPRALPFEWEFSFEGTKDDLIFLRRLRPDMVHTTDQIDRLETE